MDPLFLESDFSLFTQYQGKTQEEAPDGQAKLRAIYDKLGIVIEEVKKLGYPAEINRNPLIQGGPSTFKYCNYHWSKIYPTNKALAEECEGKVFVVIATTESGIDIHIDSNSRHGYNSDDNDITSAIKDDYWVEIPPSEAAQYTCEQLAQKVADYYKENWKQFNLFAKEFGIQESIKILDSMEIENIKNLLISNHNLILTGAPGTGKTYLAKKVAESMDAEYQLVQFHPSYDYTDFVEGLRPKNQDGQIVFERKDGVFKEFCKYALLWQTEVKKYKEEQQLITTNDGTTFMVVDVKEDGDVVVSDETSGSKEYILDFSVLDEAFKSADIISAKWFEDILTDNNIEKFEHQRNNLICYYYQALYEKFKKNKYVFIIDEINRGEISKIFGELFFSIDSGYRGPSFKVSTQYQNLIEDDDIFKNGFFVPENVYIIGTMNDIDRSVESMDFAMRRRFAWKEISAKSRQSMLDETEAWGKLGMPAQDVVKEIKNRMDNLNACIIDQYHEEKSAAKDKIKIGLTKAYQIGASYFLKYNQYNDFGELWANHIEGLLYEYLRGTTNIEAKIERLKEAYNDTEAH